MEQFLPVLTPALILGLFGWLRSDIRNLRQGINKRVDDLKNDVGQRFDQTHKRLDNLSTEMNQRFDQVNREMAENRERMAKLEGALEGFLAGRRDRDAA